MSGSTSWGGAIPVDIPVGGGACLVGVEGKRIEYVRERTAYRRDRRVSCRRRRRKRMRQTSGWLSK